MNKKLQHELLRLFEEYQRMSPLQQGRWNQRLHLAHIARIKEIISQYGWPGYTFVGQNGSNAAWLLVQHADGASPMFFKGICRIIKFFWVLLTSITAEGGRSSKISTGIFLNALCPLHAMKVQVVLEEQEEGGFTVYAPSLHGCVSQGETREEALKNIKEAIELYLETDIDEVVEFSGELITVTV